MSGVAKIPGILTEATVMMMAFTTRQEAVTSRVSHMIVIDVGEPIPCVKMRLTGRQEDPKSSSRD